MGMGIAALLAVALLPGLFFLLRMRAVCRAAVKDVRHLATIKKALLNAATDAILMVDRQGQIVIANEAASRIPETHGLSAASIDLLKHDPVKLNLFELAANVRE